MVKRDEATNGNQAVNLAAGGTVPLYSRSADTAQLILEETYSFFKILPPLNFALILVDWVSDSAAPRTQN
jgi:hypothetical protein